MTDYSQALADFMAEPDVELIRQSALESFSVDILGVYCLHTGRKVGTFDESIISFALEEESADDIESLADAMVVRTVASMRPTPMLNRPDRVTLLNLAEKRPLDVLCYLWNRLYSDSHLAVHRISALSPYLSRIESFQRWEELLGKGLDLKPWIHWLLELDAKRNLHEIKAPDLDILDSLDPKVVAARLPEFEKWVFSRLKEYDDRDKVAEQTARWMRGNSLSQPAYSRSWLENPEIAGRKTAKKSTKPKSAKAAKVDARVSKFLGLLDKVLDGEIEPTPAKPIRKAMTGADLFKKKES